jgi:small subunit ribosomal protein S8
MMTDPISDMLTRLRNAATVRATSVSMPMSKMKFAIAKLLQSEGYLSRVETVTEGSRPVLRVELAYDEQGPKISAVKRVSKPGLRVYVKAEELKPVRSGFGLAILSTPNGLMTSSEARKRRLGGELICEVY